MKNYKFLVPIVLVVLFCVSIYMSIDNNMKVENQYNEYLTQARRLTEIDIQTDALENYNNALNLKPSFELAMEIEDFYLKCGRNEEAAEWALNVKNSYPEKTEIYEFIFNYYYDNENFASCFALYDEMNDKSISSKEADEKITAMSNKYFFGSKYKNVNGFYNGYAAIENNGSWGFIDLAGGVAISPQYKKVGIFINGLAPVLDNEDKTYYIDTSGNKKAAVNTLKGSKDVIPKILGSMEEFIFTYSDGETWGLANYETGNIIINGYDELSTISEGVVAAKKENKWILLNTAGEQITKTEFEELAFDDAGKLFNNSRAFVKENGLYYMIDKTGKKLTEEIFRDVKPFIENSYAAVCLDGNWGFIDSNGKIVIEPQYEDARSFSFGFAAVKHEGKWGFINTKNKMLINNTFNNAKDFNSIGCAFVESTNEWELLKLYKYNH